MVNRVVVAIALGTVWSGSGVVPAALAAAPALPAPDAAGAVPGAIAQQPPSYAVLHVDSAVGSDQHGDGSQRRPLRTITHALRIAQPNTVILLAPGVYSDRSGETFPLQLRSGVTVQGNLGPNIAEVLIQGNSPHATGSHGLRNITLLGADQAGLANVTVNNPHPNGYGLWVPGGSPAILRSAFVGSGAAGVYLAGAGSAVIQGNYFINNGTAGLVIDTPAAPQVQGNIFDNTGTGIAVAPGASPQILDNQISRNTEGLVIHAEAQPILRNNQVTGNRRNSVVEHAPWAQLFPEPTLVAATPPQVVGPPAVSPAPRQPSPPDLTQEVTTAAAPTSRAPAALPPSTSPAPAAAIAPTPTQPSPPPGPSAVTPNPVPSGPAATIAPPPQPLPTADPAPAVSTPSPSSTASTGEGGAALLARIRASRAARAQAQVSSDQDLGASDGVEITVIPPPPTSPPTTPAGDALPPLPTNAIAARGETVDRADPPLVGNILVVPSSRIPLGSGESSPVVLTAPNTADGPPPPPSRAASLGLSYRVFIPVINDAERDRLRTFVPDTFRVQFNGQSVMQGGAFTTEAEAQERANWLREHGFSAQVEYTP